MNYIMACGHLEKSATEGKAWRASIATAIEHMNGTKILKMGGCFHDTGQLKE